MAARDESEHSESGEAMEGLEELSTEAAPDEDLEEEYTTQFFKFSPVSFVDGIYNASVGFIEEQLGRMARRLALQMPGVMNEEKAKRLALKKLLPMYEEKILNKVFDKLEIYVLNNILHLPAHVLLPEDAPQHEASAQEITSLLDRMAEAMDNIAALRYGNAQLRQELEDARATTDYVSRIVSQAEELTPVLSASAGISGEAAPEKMVALDAALLDFCKST